MVNAARAYAERLIYRLIDLVLLPRNARKGAALITSIGAGRQGASQAAPRLIGAGFHIPPLRKTCQSTKCDGDNIHGLSKIYIFLH